MHLQLVDSHCHLNLLTPAQNDPANADFVAAVIDAARENGVSHMLCACVSLASFGDVLGYARQYAAVSASVGVHPNEPVDIEPTAGELAALAADQAVVAVGETGLDYYRSTGDLDWQRERFRRHIAAALTARKPLIVHSREARGDTLEVLRQERAQEVGGVMHCFVEDWETARRAMDLNFYISFSGIVTFRNAGELKQVAARVPLDRMLVETDSPYLAPVPRRGKPNRPAYVRYVAEHIAELRGDKLETIAEATTRNFFTLFKGAARRTGTDAREDEAWTDR